MKASLKKTMLLGVVVFTGVLAASHDFSAPTHSLATSDPVNVFNAHQSVGALSTRIPRRHVVINTTLAELQEGIFGNSMAECLDFASLSRFSKALLPGKTTLI